MRTTEKPCFRIQFDTSQTLEENVPKPNLNPSLFFEEPGTINSNPLPLNPTPDLNQSSPLFYNEINSIHKVDSKSKPLNIIYLEIMEKIVSYLSFKDLLPSIQTNQKSCALIRAMKGLNITWNKVQGSDAFNTLHKHNKIKGISIEGINHLTDITKIFIFYNKIFQESITSITLADCFLRDGIFSQLKLPQNLRKLNLGNNAIGKDLDRLKTITALTELNVSNNKISQYIDLIGEMKGLIILNISFNDIDNFKNLKNLTNLTNLDASDNPSSPLSTLPTTLCSLTTLNLSNSNIKNQDLDYLSNFLNLIVLILNENDISEIKNLILPNLEQLEVRGNQFKFLTDITLTNFNELKILDISDNLKIDIKDEDEALIPKRITVRL